MSGITYRVVLDGTLAADRQRAAVIEELATLFKAPASRIAPLLSGEPVTIKRGLTLDTAAAYHAAIERAGAKCHVQPDELSPPAAASVPLAQPASPPAPLPGVPIDTSFPPAASANAPNAYWARIFAMFDRVGGATWQSYKRMPPDDAKHVVFHWPALLLGVFWYAAKGMWSRGLQLLCWCAAAIGVLEIAAGLLGVGANVTTASYFIGPAVCCALARTDYYRHWRGMRTRWQAAAVAAGALLLTIVALVLLTGAGSGSIARSAAAAGPSRAFLATPFAPALLGSNVALSDFLALALPAKSSSRWRELGNGAYVLDVETINQVTNKRDHIALVLTPLTDRLDGTGHVIAITNAYFNNASLSPLELRELTAQLIFNYSTSKEAARASAAKDTVPSKPPGEPPQAQREAAPQASRTAAADMSSPAATASDEQIEACMATQLSARPATAPPLSADQLQQLSNACAKR